MYIKEKANIKQTVGLNPRKVICTAQSILIFEFLLFANNILLLS